MLRKSLVALTAAATLGVSSIAMAGHGSHGGSAMGMSSHGSTGGSSPSVSMGAGAGKSWSGGSTMRSVAPYSGYKSGMTPSYSYKSAMPYTKQGLNKQTWNKQAWNQQAWNKHHHDRHHFRNRNFFAFGFAGPYYDDYGYDSCWRWVQTYYGLQRVYVCGDYPYWGY
jgi:hypothetical protein